MNNSPSNPFEEFQLHGEQDTQFQWNMGDGRVFNQTSSYVPHIEINPSELGNWDKVNEQLEQSVLLDTQIRKIKREMGLTEQKMFPPVNQLKLFENFYYNSGSISLKVKEGYKVKLSIQFEEAKDVFTPPSQSNHPQLSELNLTNSNIQEVESFTVELMGNDCLMIDVDRDHYEGEYGFRIKFFDSSLITEYKSIKVAGNLDCDVTLDLLSGFSPPASSPIIEEETVSRHAIAYSDGQGRDEIETRYYRTFKHGDRHTYVKTIQRFLRNQGLYLGKISNYFSQETANATNQWITIVNAETLHNFQQNGHWTPELDEATRRDIPELPVIVPGSPLSLQGYCTNTVSTFNPYQKIKLTDSMNVSNDYGFLSNSQQVFSNTFPDVEAEALALKNGAKFLARIKPGFILKFIISSDLFDFNTEFLPSELGLTENHETVGAVFQIQLELHGGDYLHVSNEHFSFRKGNNIVRKLVPNGVTHFFVHQKNITGPTGKFGGTPHGIEGSFGQTPVTSTWDDFVKEFGYKYHITKIGRSDRSIGSFYSMKIKGDVAVEVKVEGEAELKVTNIGNNKFKITKHVLLGVGIEAGSTKIGIKAGVLTAGAGVQASASATVSFTETFITTGIDHAYEIFEYLLLGYNDSLALILLDDLGIINGLGTYLNSHPNEVHREGYSISFGTKGSGTASSSLDFNLGKVGGGAGGYLSAAAVKAETFTLGLPSITNPNGYIEFASSSKFDLSGRINANLGLGINPPSNSDFAISKPDGNEKSASVNPFTSSGLDLSGSIGFTVESAERISFNSIISDPEEYFHAFAEEIHGANTTNIESKYTQQLTTNISRTIKIPFSFVGVGNYEVEISFTSTINMAKDFIEKIQEIATGGGLFNALSTILGAINIQIKYIQCRDTGNKDLGLDVKYLGVGLSLYYSSYRQERNELYSWTGTGLEAATEIYNFFVNILRDKSSNKAPNNPSLIYGIEISRHQKFVDFSRIPKAIDFVYLKATEGVGYVDPSAVSNSNNCNTESIPCGFYHFSTPSKNANGDLDCHDEAEAFASFLADNISTYSVLPPVLVLRQNLGDLTAFEMQMWVAGFLTTLQNELDDLDSNTVIDRNFILYTTPYFIKSYFPDPNSHSLDSYQLWLGNETLTTKTFDPTLHGFASPIIWQYDEIGKVNGIKTEVRKSRASQQFWT